MKIFLTSDQHFGHKNIIKYCNRPFEFSDKGVIDCIKTIFSNYNDVVTDDDIVFHLGDLAFVKQKNREAIKMLFQNLKGKKILLLGNHDHCSKEFYKECGFIDIKNYFVFGNYFLCHYPLNKTQLITEKMRALYKILKESKADIIIHGHSHNVTSADDKLYPRINVCVDYPPNNYSPVEITDDKFKEEVLKYFESLEYK